MSANVPRITPKLQRALRTAAGYLNADAEAMNGDPTQFRTMRELQAAVEFLHTIAYAREVSHV